MGSGTSARVSCDSGATATMGVEGWHSAQPPQPPQVHLIAQSCVLTGQNGAHLPAAASAAGTIACAASTGAGLGAGAVAAVQLAQPPQPPQVHLLAQSCVLTGQNEAQLPAGGGGGGVVGSGGSGGGGEGGVAGERDCEHSPHAPHPPLGQAHLESRRGGHVSSASECTWHGTAAHFSAQLLVFVAQCLMQRNSGSGLEVSAGNGARGL